MPKRNDPKHYGLASGFFLAVALSCVVTATLAVVAARSSFPPIPIVEVVVEVVVFGAVAAVSAAIGVHYAEAYYALPVAEAP
jgi:hypothetical membrane protein